MTETRVDRAALVRRAMVEAVAEHGLHGATMSLVAKRAGVATGTAYVHYESKEDLLVASFVEVKTQLGESALAGVDTADSPRAIFESVWRNIQTALEADRSVARFLIQVEASPLRPVAHEALLEDDPLARTAKDLTDHLVDLPVEILYDLGLAPAVRLVASGVELSRTETETLIEACWRAIRRV